MSRVALVTGSTKGIGRGCAAHLAASGWTVVVSGRDERQGSDVVREIENQGGVAHFVPADMTSETSILTLVESAANQWGTLDAVVHSAGIYPDAPLAELTSEDWHRVIDTNLTSAFLLAKYATPHLEKSGAGRIVFISSITGPRTGISGLTHYGSSKGGLEGLMRALAVELAAQGITVNAVSPGTILTDSLAELYSQPGVMDEVVGIIPVGRIGSPHDIALAVEFLARADCGFITGQSLIVDGGQTLPEVQGAS